MKYEMKIAEKYKESISDISDLTAGESTSLLFYFLVNCFGYLLDNDVTKTVSQGGVLVRRKLNFFIKHLGKNFLSNSQIIENRNCLENKSSVIPEKQIVLPKEPVIWTANHAFKDDTLATILAIKRHAYILFGSVPQFYNTFDGVTAWLNGVVMTNRNSKASKRASIDKAKKVMEYGADLMIFPEGVWNKSPNQLILDLWPGIWRLAKETGVAIVPVVHYIREPVNIVYDNPIHTVIDSPIKIDDLSEKAGLEYIREVLAYWYYLMMEKYGQSTRKSEMGDCEKSANIWEAHLIDRRKTVDRYDEKIEFSADYRPKWKVLPQDVWGSLLQIENITKDNAPFIAYASKLMKEERQNDFQHRF